MPTQEQVPQIIQRVQHSLAAVPGQPLRVTGEHLDDTWLYITVEPARPGVSALDHANEMSRIERELRRDGVDEVLLVPAVTE